MVALGRCAEPDDRPVDFQYQVRARRTLVRTGKVRLRRSRRAFATTRWNLRAALQERESSAPQCAATDDAFVSSPPPGAFALLTVVRTCAVVCRGEPLAAASCCPRIISIACRCGHKILAHLIARENLRRQPIATERCAVVAQDKAVMPAPAPSSIRGGTRMGRREVPVGPRKTNEWTPWPPNTSTYGSWRDFFSTTTAADAPTANAINKRKLPRNRVRINDMVERHGRSILFDPEPPVIYLLQPARPAGLS